MLVDEKCLGVCKTMERQERRLFPRSPGWPSGYFGVFSAYLLTKDHDKRRSRSINGTGNPMHPVILLIDNDLQHAQYSSGRSWFGKIHQFP